MNDLSDASFAALTEKIARDKGFGCASYKEKCLRRRIAVRMRARGVHTYQDYAKVLDTERFPTAVRVGQAAGEAHDAAYSAEHAFEFGLARTLDGLAALIER